MTSIAGYTPACCESRPDPCLQPPAACTASNHRITSSSNSGGGGGGGAYLGQGIMMAPIAVLITTIADFAAFRGVLRTH
jgi:hypothetical protein